MKNAGYYILVMLATLFCIDNVVLAGSLDKYGSDIKSTAPIVRKQTQREIAITKAVQDIQDANTDERRKLIEHYNRKVDDAVKRKSYDEAKFYLEILKRSGN